MEEGVKRVPLFDVTFPHSSYRDQTTTESSKLGIIYIFWDEEFDLLSFFQNLEI